MDFFRSSAQQKPTVNFRRASSNVWLGFRDRKGSLTQPDAQPWPDSRATRDARCVASWSANSQEEEGRGRGRASPYSKSPQRRRAWSRAGSKQAASNAGENHVLAPTPQKGRDGKRATTERRAVLSPDCEIVCGGAVGRSHQILEYIARSIEEETDGKEFAGWGD